MLKFRLLEIPTEEKEITHVFSVSEVLRALEERDCDQSRPLEPLEVRVCLRRTEKQVFARGWLRGKMELRCARCLELFVTPVRLEFQQVFLPHTHAPESEEDGLRAEDLDVTYYSGEEVDLTPIIWDELILDVPFSPLCHRDCRGLCLKCGANLNEARCHCPTRTGTARWDALRDIKL